MASIFTRIVKGEIPCYKIMEDERFFAFLEIKPLNPGHTLVIPKKETDYLFDLDDKTLGDLIVFSKKVASAIQKAVPCKKIGVVVYGLEVRHAHVHLIPIHGRSGELDFSNAKAVSNESLEEMARKIKSFVPSFQ